MANRGPEPESVREQFSVDYLEKLAEKKAKEEAEAKAKAAKVVEEPKAPEAHTAPEKKDNK